MSLTFTPLRIAIFFACLAVFWFIGGFTSLESQFGGELTIHRHSTRAWLRTLLGFIAGAFCVSFVEHKIGLLDPISLRFAYILMGTILMGFEILSHYSLIEGLEARINTAP